MSNLSLFVRNICVRVDLWICSVIAKLLDEGLWLEVPPHRWVLQHSPSCRLQLQRMAEKRRILKSQGWKFARSPFDKDVYFGKRGRATWVVLTPRQVFWNAYYAPFRDEEIYAYFIFEVGPSESVRSIYPQPPKGFNLQEIKDPNNRRLPEDGYDGLLYKVSLQ